MEQQRIMHSGGDIPPQIPQEEIPLQRLNSQEKRDMRQQWYDLFCKYDTDNNRKLNIHELKEMIRHGRCAELPRGMTRQILNMSDHDSDGYLSFEEFYKMSQAHQWLFRDFLVSYCRRIIPSPHRVEGDQLDGLYEREMSFCPPPLTMIMFSILEIIAFIIDVMYFSEDPNNNKKVGESTDGPAATLFIYNPYKRYEAWRFMTYMLVHVGIMHLMMNLLIQILLGVALELVHHWWRVSLIYLAGVVAGSMGTSLTTPRIFLAGASGGVYALITAHIATIILNWSEMEYAIIQLFVFLIFCVTDLGTSIYRHMTDVRDQVGYMAHLCGALAGLLVGLGVLRNLKVRKWEKILWVVAIIVYLALMFSGILIHILCPHYFPVQKWS